MKIEKLQVRVYLSWWVIPYLRFLHFFCLIHCLEADEKKVKKVISKGIKFEMVK